MIVVGKTIRILTAATTKSSRPDTFLQTSTARLIYTKFRRHRHRQLILTTVASRSDYSACSEVTSYPPPY